MELQETKYSKILYWMPSIIFNIVETLIIFLIGRLLGNSIYNILYILILFEIARHIIKDDKHYKNPFKCLLLTTLVFTSIFLISNINIIFSTVSSIFAAYILSGKADIEKEEYDENNNVGLFLWKSCSEPSKYKFVEDYIKCNEDITQVKKFEGSLKEMDSEYYKIYKLRFYDNKSLKYIANTLDISSTARVSEKLDNIQNILLGYVQSNKKN